MIDQFGDALCESAVVIGSKGSSCVRKQQLFVRNVHECGRAQVVILLLFLCVLLLLSVVSGSK